MYQSKLLQLLKALELNPREFKEFEKFLNSPYHNTNTDVCQLLAYIYRKLQLPEEGQKIQLDKKVVYKKIFQKEKKYKAWKMNECVSNLSKLLEKFLLHQYLKTEKRQEKKLMAEAFRLRGMDKFYFKIMEDLDKELSNQVNDGEANDPAVFSDLLQLNERIYYHPNNKKTDKENEERLNNMLNFLDTSYAIKKLQYSNEVSSRNKIYGTQIEPRFLIEIRDLAEGDFQDVPLVNAYYSILEMFEKGEVDKIPVLKNKLLDFAKKSDLSPEIKRDLIYKLLNALPYFKGRLAMYFDLYSFLADAGLLIEYGYIPADHFTNIVHLGCVCKQEDWLVDFIKKNTRYLRLEKDKLENVQLLFHAQINFYKKEYNKAFAQLFDLKIQDMTYGLRYHSLLIRTLIEGEGAIKFRYDFDACCRNFKVYVKRKYKRKEVGKVKKDGCLVFIKIATKIHYRKYEKVDTAKLIKELEKNLEIPYRSWLRNKVDQFI